jgi:hypothetical protein
MLLSRKSIEITKEITFVKIIHGEIVWKIAKIRHY